MDLTFIPFRFPGLPNARCAFQTRAGGQGAGPYARGNISLEVGDDPAAAARNRAGLAAALKIEALAELKQVHGATIVFDPPPVAPEQRPELEGDGLGTDRPGLGLMIKTADCQPVLLAHARGRHIAALHCGWRGNERNFPGTGVRDFCRRYDLRPEDLFAVRGPSLSPPLAEFVNFDREWGPAFRPWFDEEAKTMDLWGLTRRQLLEAGLRAERIFGLDLCTAAMDELFFSYRRQKTCGRQAAVIWLER